MSRFVHALVLSLSVIGVSQNGPATLAQQSTQSCLAGRWEGAVDLRGLKLPFAVVFSDNTSGLAATIDIQTAKGLSLAAVSLAGHTVHFFVPGFLDDLMAWVRSVTR